jgi:plasmid stabilization system protein ParE
MAPRIRAEIDRIVITIATQRVAVSWQLIPLLASDFARLAANAERGISQESHRPQAGATTGSINRLVGHGNRLPNQRLTAYQGAVLIRSGKWEGGIILD